VLRGAPCIAGGGSGGDQGLLLQTADAGKAGAGRKDRDRAGNNQAVVGRIGQHSADNLRSCANERDSARPSPYAYHSKLTSNSQRLHIRESLSQPRRRATAILSSVMALGYRIQKTVKNAQKC
jgi:hypothetical protein